VDIHAPARQLGIDATKRAHLVGTDQNTAVRGSLDLIHENRKSVPIWKTATGKRRSQMEGKDIFEQIGVR
jgi:hypothetical protein